jgi:hypothetical protein
MINLAGVETCDTDIRRELMGAGITAETVERVSSEVPYSLVGRLGDWTFERAWYYWMASTPEGMGVPEAEAEGLNQKWRREVRVAGFASGTEVGDWLSNQGTVDSYHIDTPEGLSAFARLLGEVVGVSPTSSAK